MAGNVHLMSCVENAGRSEPSHDTMFDLAICLIINRRGKPVLDEASARLAEQVCE